MDFTYRQEQILLKVFADHAAYTTDQIAQHNIDQENDVRFKQTIGLAKKDITGEIVSTGNPQDGYAGSPLFKTSGLKGSGLSGGKVTE